MGDLFIDERGCRVVGPQSGGGGEGCFRREKLAQSGLVHLLRGFSPGKGREAGGSLARGKPLCCPQVLGGG